ncbi:beta family protein [Cellulomonas iranensis]|uniref:Beta protein n=1 Tax=Cellulomonas iranensis TaxID=76862 RepID=A0ABU0GKQ9_9CELL|nr:beta family protein [Cellulomonas iranensis]MDQ0425152.1 hypothetical protein [Cellulomonas iranensis]
MTFDHRHYVPVVLTKRGERRALGDLSPSVKSHLTPLFEVAPIDWNFDLDEPSKTIDGHLSTLGPDLAACWGHDRAFVDMQFIAPTERMADGSHPLDWLIAQANAAGVTLLPSVSPGRDVAYRAAAARAVARDRRGACIRLTTGEWPSATGVARLDELLRELAIAPADVDLILDLAEDVAASSELALTAVRNELNALPYAADWRTVTVSGAGFPKDLSGVGRGLSAVERTEWVLYQDLLAGSTTSVVPQFGDYGVAHPDPILNIDPRLLSISAAFRYTIDLAWLVAKGELFKGAGGSGKGGAAALPVAAAIAADPRFAGASHCAGDAWIAAVPGSGGNPEAWRRVATTHHLTHVAEAVSRLP